MYGFRNTAKALCVLAIIMPISATAAQTANAPVLTVEAFQEELAKRDEIIIDLLRRMKALEARISEENPTPTVRRDAMQQKKIQQIPARSDARPTGQAAKAPAAPGKVVVDELTAQRALERSLVDTGVLLLPPGQAEIAPSLTYQRNSVENATTVNVGGLNFVADNRIDQDVLDGSLFLRHGLPWASQIELSMPYRFVRRDETVDVLGGIQSSEDTSGHGVGDLRVGLAKTILEKADGWPDLIARVSWDTGIGRRTDNGVSLGFGFDEVQGQLTALYRQDPMVFVGTVGYEYTFERDDIRPGEEFLFSIGTNIAVSPETSLSFFLDQVYRNDLKFSGRRIDGSDQLSSSLSIGASTIVGPRTLLRLTAGVGLTDEAPDYSLAVSLPVRFSTGLK